MNFGNNTRLIIKNKIIKNNLIPYECAECNISEWNGQPLSLHLDHIDGDNSNNQLSNFRFLCPNCHSQTETYCGKNNKLKYGIKNQKISDGDLLELMKLSVRPTDALKAAGLAGAGNYTRIYRLAEIHNIEHMKKPTKKIYKLICKCCGVEFQTVTKKEANKLFCSRDCYSTQKLKSGALHGFSYEEIVTKLNELDGNYRQTGKFFGVSDNAIRKRLLKEETI